MTACTTIIVEPERTDGVPVLEQIDLTFDANGNAIVTVGGDEDTANMYVTVGDGVPPSDPTASVNDGSVSGRNGVVTTSVKITQGNAAIVKAVGADSNGTLGPVRTSRADRRIGPLDKDTSDRSTSGTGEDVLESVTIPGGVLGSNGAFRVYAAWRVNNTNDTCFVRVRFSSDFLGGYAVAPSAFERIVVVSMLVFNDGVDDAQQAVSQWTTSELQGAADIQESAIDTSANKDLRIAGECLDAGDTVTLVVHTVELIGTD